ncbi:MAG: hypothetical protein ABI137_07345 [Antricoccus sp.]
MTNGDLMVLIEDGGIIAMPQPRSLGTSLHGPAGASDAARRPVSHTELMALLPTLLPSVLG